MKIVLKFAAGSRLQKVAGGVTLGVFLALSIAPPAHSAGRDWHGPDRAWNDHVGAAHRYWNHPHFRPEPGVVYAPPVVYSPPQYEEPGINLVLPLNFR